MEFAIFLSNTILIGWVLYWCMLNTTRKPGTKVKGFFVWREQPRGVVPPVAGAGRKPQPGRWEGRR